MRYYEGFGGAKVIETLNVEEAPRGCVSRYLLDMIHDPMGYPIRIPIIVVRGERPGKVFGLTAAVHGNELNGIPVIHNLVEKLDPKHMRGSVVAVPVVNIPGFMRQKRFFNDSVDLNKIMPGKEDGSISQVYCHRFCERVLPSLDYLVDLHTASFGRYNSLYVRADMTHETTAQMAYLQRPQIILHNRASDGTLRGHAMSLGIPAITLEIGNPHRFQPELIRHSLTGLRAMLGEAGISPKRNLNLGASPVFCERSYWLYTDHGGLLEVFPKITDHVEAGTVVARLSNVFSDVIEEYRIKESGVVIGKSVNPVGQTGARILHLGIIATPECQKDFVPPRKSGKSHH